MTTFEQRFEQKLERNKPVTLEDFRRALGDQMSNLLDLGYGPNPTLFSDQDGIPSQAEYLAQTNLSTLDSLTGSGNFGLATIAVQRALSAIVNAENLPKELASGRANAAAGYLNLASQADPKILETVQDLVGRINNFSFREPFRED